MVNTFYVRDDPNAHEQVQAWRREHPDGFLINRKSASSGMVHRVECPHLGDSQWKAESGQDLARQQKICSLNFRELIVWAKENGLSKLAKCADCRPVETLDLIREFAEEVDPAQFIPDNLADARRRVLASIVQRQGQPAFRSQLLKSYGSRCAFSGCAVAEVLEAAHILPYQGPLTNHPQNGLLLRTDLHTLFDLGLLAVDTKTMTVVTSAKLDNSSYADLLGCRVHIPTDRARAPSFVALDQHREKAGLTLRQPRPKR
jgi:hypothetical protein